MMMTLLRLEESKLVRLLIQPTKLLMIRLKKEILKEDMILKPNENGLMTNKARQ